MKRKELAPRTREPYREFRSAAFRASSARSALTQALRTFSHRSPRSVSGEAIIIPTNNANFIGTSETGQQIAQGRVQAVAHGRAVLQVSTTGTTAVISPRGVIEQELPDNTQSSLVAELPLRTTRTIADRLGHGPATLIEVAGALLAIAGMVSAGRRRWAARAPRGGHQARRRTSGPASGAGRSSSTRRKRT